MKKSFPYLLAISMAGLFVLSAMKMRAQGGTNCSAATNITLSTTGSTCLNGSAGQNNASV